MVLCVLQRQMLLLHLPKNKVTIKSQHFIAGRLLKFIDKCLDNEGRRVD
jgi:hypothetical protein